MYSILPDLEGDTHVLHLLEDGVPPKCVTILFIELLGLPDVFWYSYAKLLSSDPLLRLDLCYYSVPFLQHKQYPPGKSLLLG